MKEFSCKFPSDWIELNHICSGFELKQCIIYGLYSVRQMSLENRELIVLVEGMEAKLLVANCLTNDRKIYYIDVESDKPELIDFGDCFFNALNQYLKM